MNISVVLFNGALSLAVEYFETVLESVNTDYEFFKRSDLRCEEIKKTTITLLENAVKNLKERIPEDKPRKMGKVVKLRIAN